MRQYLAAAMVLGLLVSFGWNASAADVEEGFISLFHGQDLTGWVKRGGSAEYRVEIANSGKDSALWHTAGIVDGKTIPGRGWVVTNDEFVEKVRNKDDQWNTTCTAAYGDRLVQTLNGFCTSDLVDKACEKTGKLGLQMHGGTDCEMFFKDFEVLPITDDMLKLIERKIRAND